MKDLDEFMSKLTPKERQVCEAIRQNPGLNYQGIGQQVGISKHTVNFHLKAFIPNSTSTAKQRLQQNYQKEVGAMAKCKPKGGKKEVAC